MNKDVSVFKEKIISFFSFYHSGLILSCANVFIDWNWFSGDWCSLWASCCGAYHSCWLPMDGRTVFYRLSLYILRFQVFSWVGRLIILTMETIHFLPTKGLEPASQPPFRYKPNTLVVVQSFICRNSSRKNAGGGGCQCWICLWYVSRMYSYWCLC